jgi:predicted metal-dependent peptidase
MEYDIEVLKRKMLVKYPFFGSVVANVNYKENKNISTAGTDGETIYYNPEYLERLSIEEQTFIFAHEVCHIAFNHILRSEGKDSELWNVATDGVINQFLKRDGLKMPSGLVDIAEAINYDAEQLYEKLLQAKQQKQQQQQNEQSNGQNGEENQQQSGKSKGEQQSQSQQQESSDSKSSEGQDKQSQELSGGSSGNGSQEKDGNSKQDGNDTHSMWKDAVRKHKEQQENAGKKENLLDKLLGKDNKQKNNDKSKLENQQQNEQSNGQNGEEKQQHNSKSNGKQQQPQSQQQESSDSGSLEEQDKQPQEPSGGSSGNDSQEKDDNSKQDGNDTHSMWKDAVRKHKEQQEKAEKKNLLDKKLEKDNNKKDTEKTELEKEQEKLEGMGEKEAFKKNIEDKKKQLEELKEEILKQALQAGTSTNKDVRTVNDIGVAKTLIDWRYVLRETTKYDVDWSYKNATIEDGVVTSHLEEQPISETEIVLDTSGSISEVLLKNFLRECKNILRHSRLKVGCFDIEFYGFHEIRTEEDIENMEFIGGGGTNFNAAVGAFSRRVKNKIIFTDGNAIMPDKPIDAIWIVFGGKKINPKGGKVINLTEEQLNRLYSDEIANKTKGRLK